MPWYVLFRQFLNPIPVNTHLHDRELIGDDEVEIRDGNDSRSDTFRGYVVGQIIIPRGVQTDSDLGERRGSKKETYGKEKTDGSPP